MGEVYKAKDTRLDRTVAIKVLPSHLADNPDLKQRFEREARAVSSLNHPHICTLFDIGEQDGTDYLVMEYIDGEDLASVLRRLGRPSADKAAELARRQQKDGPWLNENSRWLEGDPSLVPGSALLALSYCRAE